MSAPTKFTPGPWIVTDPDQGLKIRAADPGRPGKLFLVAEIGPRHRSYADEQMAGANARLIAAAPELYEALSELLPEGWDDGTMDHMRGVAKARAALARTRGEG